MLGSTKIIVGLVIVFISVFMLFFIIDSISKFSEKCKVPELRVATCDRLTGTTEVMLIILLIVAGFVIMILTTGYILFAA